MGNQKVSNSRRAVLSKALGLSVLSVAMPSSWTKPVVNAVILPGHAMMSPDLVECPTVVVGDVEVFGGASGGACSVNFSFFSATSTPLTITSITNTAVTDTSSITYDDSFPVEVTDAVGTLVTWTGDGVTDAFCPTGGGINLLDGLDVTFTVEATCENGIEPISVDFLLSDIVADSPAADA